MSRQTYECDGLHCRERVYVQGAKCSVCREENVEALRAPGEVLPVDVATARLIWVFLLHDQRNPGQWPEFVLGFTEADEKGRRVPNWEVFQMTDEVADSIPHRGERELLKSRKGEAKLAAALKLWLEDQTPPLTYEIRRLPAALRRKLK